MDSLEQKVEELEATTERHEKELNDLHEQRDHLQRVVEDQEKIIRRLEEANRNNAQKYYEQVAHLRAALREFARPLREEKDSE